MFYYKLGGSVSFRLGLDRSTVRQWEPEVSAGTMCVDEETSIGTGAERVLSPHHTTWSEDLVRADAVLNPQGATGVCPVLVHRAFHGETSHDHGHLTAARLSLWWA